MKLIGVLVSLCLFSARLKNSRAMSTTQSDEMDGELLERAALQLGRLSGFRRNLGESQQTVRQNFLSQQDNRQQYHSGGAIPTDGEKPEEEEEEDMAVEVQRRIDELKAALLQEPRYQAMMQDRIKRSFISGIANKLVGGVVGAASGASRGIAGLSSSNTPTEYGGAYGHSYQTKFDIGDFAKAIINTLVQAIKAIGGGAIAGGGALVKGGGYLVSAKGQIISSAGSAITSLGKSIASSAIIASPKPVYGPPAGYSYNPAHTPEEPSHDLTYDGPPPSADAYAGPEDGYNAGHSSYAAPSNEDGVDEQAGILIVKETKPDGHGLEHHPPSSSIHDSSPNLSTLEDTSGGSSKGPSATITKITGIFNSGQLPVTDQDHRNQEHVDYYPDQQQPPSSVSSYQSGGFQSNHDAANGDGQVYDSYGTKIQPYSGQFTSDHTTSHRVNNDHEALSLTTLNTHLEVPKYQPPNDFKDFSPSADYQYHNNNNVHHSEPLKIPIFTSHQNSLDNSYDNRIEAFNYYGSPALVQSSAPAGAGAADTSPQLSFSDYNSYQVANPGFDRHIQNPSSTIVGKPTILGVWSRISRRTNNPVKKAAIARRAPEIQRSIDYYYALTNAKLTRI